MESYHKTMSYKKQLREIRLFASEREDFGRKERKKVIIAVFVKLCGKVNCSIRP